MLIINQSKSEQVKGYDQLQLQYDPISFKVAPQKGTIDLVMELLDLMDIRVDEKRKMIKKEQATQTPSSVGNGNNVGNTPTSDAGQEGDDLHIRDPLVRGCPHRTMSHRFYSASEKAMKGKQKEAGVDLEVMPGDMPSTPKKGRKANKQKNSGTKVPGHDEQAQGVPISWNLNALSNGSCFYLVDPDGSVGTFRPTGGTQRVLFQESTAEVEASNVASRTNDFDTTLTP